MENNGNDSAEKTLNYANGADEWSDKVSFGNPAPNHKLHVVGKMELGALQLKSQKIKSTKGKEYTWVG